MNSIKIKIDDEINTTYLENFIEKNSDKMSRKSTLSNKSFKSNNSYKDRLPFKKIIYE